MNAVHSPPDPGRSRGNAQRFERLIHDVDVGEYFALMTDVQHANDYPEHTCGANAVSLSWSDSRATCWLNSVLRYSANSARYWVTINFGGSVNDRLRSRIARVKVLRVLIPLALNDRPGDFSL